LREARDKREKGRAMKQVLHIFKKDFRHCWRECAASIVLLVVYAWNDVHTWGPSRSIAFTLIGSGLLSVGPVLLLVFSWWFLTTRAVQDESLVGDRQFWVTRPYDWKQLLISKVLFVVVFVNLPLFVAQIILLRIADLPVLPSIYGLLYVQLILSLALLIPVAALATVTPTVVQMVLAVLAVILCLIGLAALGSVIPSSSVGEGSDFLQGLIVIVMALTVIVWQYARRKVAVARWMIAATVSIVGLLVIATPYRTMIEREYPTLEAGRQPPLRLELRPVQTPVTRDDSGDWNTVDILIPMNVSGMAAGSFVVLNGLETTIEAPGVQWRSGWVGYYESLFPDQDRTELRFTVKRALYDQIKTLPAHTRFSLAFTVFHERGAHPFVIPSGHFDLPGFGLCAVSLNYSYSISCRSALHGPSLVLVTNDISATTCPEPQYGAALAPSGTLAHEPFLNSTGPADDALSPVRLFTISPSVDNRYGETPRTDRGLCPGTPLTVSAIELVVHRRIDIDLGSIRLLDYHRGNGLAYLR
jgi:hypothetical protein